MSFESVQSHSRETESNIESLAWRKLKELAPEEATKRIKSIEGFEDMGPVEQNAALWEVLQQLEEEGNHRRFEAKFVANHMVANDELIKHQVTTTANENYAPRGEAAERSEAA